MFGQALDLNQGALTTSGCVGFRHRTFALVMPRIGRPPALAGAVGFSSLVEWTLAKQGDSS